jgi:hypothetical protein
MSPITSDVAGQVRVGDVVTVRREGRMPDWAMVVKILPGRARFGVRFRAIISSSWARSIVEISPDEVKNIFERDGVAL